MALSDYELQVLRELETQLQRRKPSWRARVATFWCIYEWAVVVGMLAAILVVAVFAVGAVVAPVAGVLCAATGYQLAVARGRRTRPRR